jgi:anaerobic glycerol-3-phosphate dehydrogenase C subunit
MDERRSKIQEDLRGLITGEVQCDDIARQLYASDASIYQMRPLGVVRPRSTEDVAACVRYCAEHAIPIHPRGSGTGLAGESLGEGLVLDFSRYMRKTLWSDATSVRVQPGLTLGQLNRQLATRGRTFGPDPATGEVTTLGSVISVDAAGSHSLRYGQASDYVRSMQVVLSDGTILELGREQLPGFRLPGSARADIPTNPADVRRRELISQLAGLIRRHGHLIEKCRSKYALDRAGYRLSGLLTLTHLNLTKLLCGSEGTLALVTEMTLESVPLPRNKAVLLGFFSRLESAARAAYELRQFRPRACDLLDRRLMSLARDTDPRYDTMIPLAAEAALLIETDGENPAAAAAALEQIHVHLRKGPYGLGGAIHTTDPAECELLWQLSRRVTSTLYRLKGSTRAVPVIEDMAVPPERLAEFLVVLQNTLKKYQVTASLFAHAGHGQLHVRPFLDLSQSQDVRTMRSLAQDVYQQVFAVGGTVSGEHAAGLSRTPFLPLQFGELYTVFREVKRMFDPQNIFNPGKIVGDDPYLIVRNLREGVPQLGRPKVVSERVGPQVVPLQLNWTPAEVAQTTRACNGCGQCRSLAPGGRMCPIYRALPSEEASPRAKANLMRGLMAGRLPPTAVESDDFKDVVDLCVNCKMCQTECPAGVDIPRLMLEARASYVAINGLPTTDWLLSRLESISALGSRFAPLANWAIANPQARWWIEKMLGIARGRKLPQFTGRPFMRRAARRRLTRPTARSGPKVLYFVDAYANYHDPQIGEALVSVLEHNGVAVYVHPGQASSGMALITAGALDRARQIARHNVGILAEAVRQGYTIVSAEPSAVICLKQEYPSLLDDPEAQFVADHSMEALQYLWQLHRDGKLKLDFSPIAKRLAYHEPCHSRALGGQAAAAKLLWLIPELDLRAEEHGCSGMAGTYGLKKKNYRLSLRAGRELVQSLREPTLDGGTTECSACKLQMEQGTKKPTIHPLKLLASAYGLMPSVKPLLDATSKPLTVT